jgi:excinuclease ABC subunit C
MSQDDSLTPDQTAAVKRREALLGQAKDTSQSPGVYLMRSEKSTVLYVGKAKNLKKRVTTYFQAATHASPRTEFMVSQVHRFDVILTETEAEALILECNLIKKHKPKFNVRLKDDKSYPYIRVSTEADFPKLEWTRRVRKDGSRYFGPFTSAWGAKQVMRLLNETFLLRDCSDNTFNHRSRPCILHQMGKCSAPCVQLISQADYRETIDDAMAVLDGKSDRLMKSLEKGMHDAADKEEFEEAAFYRDQISNLKLVTETQTVMDPETAANRDVIGLARSKTLAQGTLVKVRNGKMLGVEHFLLQNVDPELGDADILFDVLAQTYVLAAQEDDASVLPGQILLEVAPTDHDVLEKAIGVGIRTPETKEEQQLVGVAKSNAEYALEAKAKKEIGHGLEALEEVASKLMLERVPHRMECYDISNIQGSDPVASRVVFVGGAPDKNLYRRYKIKTVVGSNDFAMMKEVLDRRFARVEEELPDLVVVDGGKGQLAQAVAILDELNVQGVEVVGLAKARTERGFQEEEVKQSAERIFKPGRKNPILLKPNTGAFRVLTHIRDEAHRFAVSFHRLRRKKRHFNTSD